MIRYIANALLACHAKLRKVKKSYTHIDTRPIVLMKLRKAEGEWKAERKGRHKSMLMIRWETNGMTFASSIFLQSLWFALVQWSICHPLREEKILFVNVYASKIRPHFDAWFGSKIQKMLKGSHFSTDQNPLWHCKSDSEQHKEAKMIVVSESYMRFQSMISYHCI